MTIGSVTLAGTTAINPLAPDDGPRDDSLLKNDFRGAMPSVPEEIPSPVDTWVHGQTQQTRMLLRGSFINGGADDKEKLLAEQKKAEEAAQAEEAAKKEAEAAKEKEDKEFQKKLEEMGLG